MSESLVISSLGEDREGIVKDLSKIVLDCGGNIAESRMTQLGGEFATIMLVQGNEETLSKIEHAKGQMEDLGLVVHLKRTSLRGDKSTHLPYLVEVVAIDHPGIVHDITDFFSTRNVNIQDLTTETYAAAHTGTPMFAVNIQLQVPSSSSLKKLKGEFLEFCDVRNLDGDIQPDR